MSKRIDEMSEKELDKEIEKVERQLFAEERNDPDQIIINISPDIFEKLQNEFLDMQEQGYKGRYNDFLRSKIRVTKAGGGLISNYKVELRKP